MIRHARLLFVPNKQEKSYIFGLLRNILKTTYLPMQPFYVKLTLLHKKSITYYITIRQVEFAIFLKWQ